MDSSESSMAAAHRALRAPTVRFASSIDDKNRRRSNCTHWQLRGFHRVVTFTRAADYIDRFLECSSSAEGALHELRSVDLSTLEGLPHEVAVAGACAERLSTGHWSAEKLINALELTDPERLDEPVIDDVLLLEVPLIDVLWRVAEGAEAPARAAFAVAVDKTFDPRATPANATRARTRLRHLAGMARAKSLHLFHEALLSAEEQGSRARSLANGQQALARTVLLEFRLMKQHLQPPPSLAAFGMVSALSLGGAIIAPFTWLRVVASVVLVGVIGLFVLLRKSTSPAFTDPEVQARFSRAEALIPELEAIVRRTATESDPRAQRIIDEFNGLVHWTDGNG